MLEIKVVFKGDPKLAGSRVHAVGPAIDRELILSMPEGAMANGFEAMCAHIESTLLYQTATMKLIQQSDDVYIEILNSMGERYYIKNREGRKGLWHRFIEV